MDELVDVLEQLTAQPPRLPRSAQELARVSRRRLLRRRVVAASFSAVALIGLVGAAGLLASRGQPETFTAGRGTASSEPSVTTPSEGDGTETEGPTQRPSDEPLRIVEAAATPARPLRQHESSGITWRLTERGTNAGRCLEVTAVVDTAAHSRGGRCHFSPDPSPGAWDLEEPVRFVIGDTTFVVLFGRAGADVAAVRVSDPLAGNDEDVSAAWIVVSDDVGSPIDVVIESIDIDGETLLSERVNADPANANSLDVAGLIAELEIAGATVTQPAPGPGDDGRLFVNPEGSSVWSGDPATLCVNGSSVRLFEYPDTDQRERDSATITTEGQIQGPGFAVIPEWVGPPRFFAAGRLIALHLSEDPTTLNLLTSTFGPTLSPDGVGARGAGEPPCD